MQVFLIDLILKLHVHVLCLYVTDQVRVSSSSPGTLGHVPVCRWTRLGHGVVSYTRHSPGDPVHRSGLPSRDGRPARCQQGVHGAWAGAAVGCGQSGVKKQVLELHKPAKNRKSPLRPCMELKVIPKESGLWLLLLQSHLPAQVGLRFGPGQRLHLAPEVVPCRGLGAPQLWRKGGM